VWLYPAAAGRSESGNAIGQQREVVGATLGRATHAVGIEMRQSERVAAATGSLKLLFPASLDCDRSGPIVDHSSSLLA
jgi:hypothetical protein